MSKIIGYILLGLAALALIGVGIYFRKQIIASVKKVVKIMKDGYQPKKA